MTRHALLAGLLALLALVLVMVVGIAVVELFEQPAPGLGRAIDAVLSETRVANPVTAVLLDLRGYDTLLEVGVLLLAWLGASASTVHGPAEFRSSPSSPIVAVLIRILVGPMLLLAGYLLWVGADSPGGAFQAGAVGAAAIIARRLAGDPRLSRRSSLHRLLPVVGLAVFVLVATAVAAVSGTFHDFPRSVAREAMMLIEIAAAFSVAAILAGLFDVVTGARGVG